MREIAHEGLIAHGFIEALLAPLFKPILFNFGKPPTEDRIRYVVGIAVRAFLAHWQPVASTAARLADEGCELVLTVDCGITAVAEVEEARRLGLDVGRPARWRCHIGERLIALPRRSSCKSHLFSQQPMNTTRGVTTITS